MASVPYSGGVPSIEPQVGVPNDYQNIRSTPAEFGGLVGQGEEALGAGALKAAHFFGEVAADDATNQFMEKSRTILSGDPNAVWTDDKGQPILDENGQTQPDRGFYGLQGRAALEARPRVEAQIDDLRNQLRSGMLTPEQSLLFDQYTRRMQFYMSSDVGRHADQQANVWAGEVEKASAVNHQTALAQAALKGDWDEVARQEGDLVGAYTKTASRLGGGNEMLDAARNKGKAESADIQIRALMPTNPGLAGQILERNREVLAAFGRYDALANTVQTRADRSAADGAFTRAIGPAGTGASVADRNLANNNPGNIKAPDGGWMSYPTPEAGVAAIGSWLGRAQNVHGLTTVRQLIDDREHGYAPSADPGNRGKALPEAAAAALGVDPDAKVDMNDPGMRQKMVGAILRQEQGAGAARYAQAGPPTMTDAGTAALAGSKPDYAAALARLNADQTLSPKARVEATSMLRQQYSFDYEVDQRAAAAATKARIDQQATVEADLFAKAVRKEPLDPHDLAGLVQTRQITPQGYNAIMGEVTRAGQPGQNNWATIMHLEQQIGAGEDVTSDIQAAAEHGSLRGETASQLMQKQLAAKKAEHSQVERSYFSSLRTLAGMDATEHPMVDLDRESNKAQVQLWAQAQSEWNSRVLLGKENPADVYADMVPRYGHPVQSVRALPRPRLGVIQKTEDVATIARQTRAAADSGQLTPDQFNQEKALIVQYQQLFEAEEKRKATLQAVPAGTDRGRARPVGVRPADITGQ